MAGSSESTGVHRSPSGKGGGGKRAPKSNDEGGVLGHINAYYGCVEAQGRGTLHCHLIIWLSGALNCDQIRNRVLFGDQEFQRQLINFIDNCITNEIPSKPSDNIKVPSDDIHPCSVRPVKNYNNDIARKKDLHNLVKACQIHKHSATCFKYWKGPPPR